MKIVHLSTGVGASSANTHLHEALLKQGIDSNIVTLYHSGELEKIYDTDKNIFYKIKEIYYQQKLKYNLKFIKIDNQIPFSFGERGIDIVQNSFVKSADIIHLHWICNFLSIYSIRKLIQLGKPIVWTCHDSWPFTGGCHVRNLCEKYQMECGECVMIHSKKKKDLSTKVFVKKAKKWKKNKIVFIAPSNWMKQNIEKSKLFSTNRTEIIPNTLNLELFFRRSIKQIEKLTGYIKETKKINILFGAGSVEIPYKGYRYLLEVLEEIKCNDQELAEKIIIHIIGADNRDDDVLKGFCCKFWGYIEEQEIMSCIYSVADVFLYPSIDDNLPNMVMESMACETPVVAFETGGIPDMVLHQKCGYLAEYKNTKELLKGLKWVIMNNESNKMGIFAAQKINLDYNEEVVAKRHISLYEELLFRGEQYE